MSNDKEFLNDELVKEFVSFYDEKSKQNVTWISEALEWFKELKLKGRETYKHTDMNNEKEFIWNGTKYELEEVDWLPSTVPFDWNTPLLKFNNKTYIGKAIANISPKERKVLFTTSDGKEIFEGDDWWIVGVSYDRWAIKKIEFDRGHLMNPDYEGKRFSTEDKAKEYIAWNKKQFSLAEIMANSEFIPNLKGQNIYQFNQSKLTNLAEQKINESDTH